MEKGNKTFNTEIQMGARATEQQQPIGLSEPDIMLFTTSHPRSMSSMTKKMTLVSYSGPNQYTGHAYVSHGQPQVAVKINTLALHNCTGNHFISVTSSLPQITQRSRS